MRNICSLPFPAIQPQNEYYNECNYADYLVLENDQLPDVKGSRQNWELFEESIAKKLSVKCPQKAQGKGTNTQLVSNWSDVHSPALIGISLKMRKPCRCVRTFTGPDLDSPSQTLHVPTLVTSHIVFIAWLVSLSARSPETRVVWSSEWLPLTAWHALLHDVPWCAVR